MRVARLFLFADWPERYFSGQSEGVLLNASGTRSARVSAQGLSRSCCKLSPIKIPSSRLAAPGSPRMRGCLPASNSTRVTIKRNLAAFPACYRSHSRAFQLSFGTRQRQHRIGKDNFILSSMLRHGLKLICINLEKQS